MSKIRTSVVAALREELASAQRENEDLHAENQKLRETAHRMNARLSALTEENEQLRKERDSYKEQLQEAKEQHETELREVTEEMAAAARFTEKEWREHCDRVEAQCGRLRRAVDACMPTVLEYLPYAEAAARRRLHDEEKEQRRSFQGRRWKASLKQVSAREANHAEAVFAARGFSIKVLRRKHLGKERTTRSNSYAAGKGLYNLFLALRPGGPVDSFAMRELLKGETDVTHVHYNAQAEEYQWRNTHFTIPAADACELAAWVLCHLPALKDLRFLQLPPLSTCNLEWVSHLRPCVQELYFCYTDYTVADLRELHRRRGSSTFRVDVHSEYCTDWGEFAGGVADDEAREIRVSDELGGMVWWCYSVE